MNDVIRLNANSRQILEQYAGTPNKAIHVMQTTITDLNKKVEAQITNISSLQSAFHDVTKSLQITPKQHSFSTGTSYSANACNASVTSWSPDDAYWKRMETTVKTSVESLVGRGY